MSDIDFAFEKSTSIHDKLATEMNTSLQEADIPEKITKGKTILI